jgi:hypothetical protein
MSSSEICVSFSWDLQPSLLRQSEVVRLKMEDVTLEQVDVNGDGNMISVLNIHVDRLSKNDHHRLGHTRLIPMAQRN